MQKNDRVELFKYKAINQVELGEFLSISSHLVSKV